MSDAFPKVVVAKMFHSRVAAFLGVVLFTSTLATVDAGLLYWTESDRIMRSDSVGSNATTLINLSATTHVRGIALDAINNHVYWTEAGESDIHRANTDGSGGTTLVDKSGSFGMSGLELDVANNRMYWGEGNSIQSAELDGSNAGVFGPPSGARGGAVDTTNDHVYWASHDLFRYELNGSNRTTINGTPSAFDIAVDSTQGHLYWSDNVNNRIWRSDLDGSNLTSHISTNVDDVKGIALDVTNNRMYWINATVVGGDIYQANLDGTGITSVVQLSGNAYFLALDSQAVPEPSSLLLMFTGAIMLVWRGTRHSRKQLDTKSRPREELIA